MGPEPAYPWNHFCLVCGEDWIAWHADEDDAHEHECVFCGSGLVDLARADYLEGTLLP